MPSEKLIAWHSQNCPKTIDIDSEEFTNFLLKKIAKLKQEIMEV